MNNTYVYMNIILFLRDFTFFVCKRMLQLDIMEGFIFHPFMPKIYE